MDINFAFMVSSLMSEEAKKEWLDMNPSMDVSVQSELMNLIATTLLLASSIQHTKLLELECSKLCPSASSNSCSSIPHPFSLFLSFPPSARRERQLTKLEEQLTKIRETPEAPLDPMLSVLAKGIVNFADSIASSLQAERHYFTKESAHDYSFDPRLLVFEFIRSIILREKQIEVVTNFMASATPENAKLAENDPENEKCHKLAQQMLMGQGKTAIITPLLCLLLGTDKQLPLVMLPPSLLEAGRAIVSSTFSSVIIKRVYTLHCTRASVAEGRYLNIMRNALKHKSIVCTTPSCESNLELRRSGAMIELTTCHNAEPFTRAPIWQLSSPSS